MKTVAIKDKKYCELIEKPMPKIDGNYVLLKVHVAPMCNEHIAYQHSVYLERNRPDSLGHEMAGEVVQVGPNASVKIGQRVVALCGFPCGECLPCIQGYYAHCAANQDPRSKCNSESGECSFAQYAIKADWMLVPIPENMSYEHASMACCGLGPTFGAMERMRVDAFSTVLITGLGPVGLGGIITAKFRGATVIGVAGTPYRANLAKKLGCDYVLDASQANLNEKIAELTDDRGVDFALECSGQPHYQRLVLDTVGRLGSVCFLSEPGEIVINIDNILIQKGVTLLGSLDINRKGVDRLLKMIKAIPEQLNTFITHRFSLEEITKAFELQVSRECGKIIIYPWSDRSA